MKKKNKILKNHTAKIYEGCNNKKIEASLIKKSNLVKAESKNAGDFKIKACANPSKVKDKELPPKK